MTDFTHIHKDLSQFSRFYTDEMEPKLINLEKRRQTLVTQFRERRLYAVGVAFVVGLLALLIFKTYSFAVIAAFATGAAGFGLVYQPLDKFRKEAHEDILPPIAENLGMHLQTTDFAPLDFERYQHYQMLPQNYDRSAFEDLLTGQRHGADFTIYEAHLEREVKSKNSTYWKTVFHGQLFKIDYHKKFLGETVVTRDAGILNRFSRPGKNFSNVGLASPAFEKAFEAWSTDQVEARDLLDPIVLERFLELERLYMGKNLRAAWADDCLYIALETGDKMQMGSVFHPMNGQNRIETILKEFAAIYDLVDVILKPTQGRMTGSFSVGDVRQ